MKWLIVEDEAIEREGLKKMLLEAFPELELAGEAVNGREAVTMAQEQKPDLITMDIKMPGMDGVEAVKQIKSFDPAVKIVMMTAYDEFEYARDVMRSGVKEYVLKPAKKKELVSTIERVLEEIAEEKQERKTARLGNLSFIQSEWIQAYFTERMLENYPEEIASFFPETSGDGCAWIVSLEEASKEKHTWIKEKIEEQAYGVVGPFLGGVFPVWIFAFKNRGMTASISLLNQWVRSILHSFQSEFREKASIGIGSFVDDPNQLINSYHEAMIALSFVKDRKGYVHYQEAQSKINLEDFNKFLNEKAIYESIRNGNRELAIQQFEQLWSVLEEMQENLILRCKGIVQVIYGMARELGWTSDYWHEEFPEGKSKREWRVWTIDQIAQAAEIVKSYKHVTSKDAISQAEEWIQHNYHRPLTLEELAEHVSLNPYYFSKLFKERFQKSFIDYLTELRISKAQELLTTTDKPLKEISAVVGYKDPNYFSRVFKKKIGSTPTQFREMILTSK
ncbi:response regulator [Halobacillus salinarum]|uniref:Response regulator n=1 Tax=Halobacillus salinarum TaxID=2932257 RepID=A0ABY4EJS3_9BACI|nr:response regulator [Halobacillus salinarum]UOQ44419.1 response regulator [Halobacillus salinarum]